MVEPRVSSARYRRVERIGEHSSQSDGPVKQSGNRQEGGTVPRESISPGTGFRDETANIMVSRRKKTDSLLETLQRSLREQLVSEGPQGQQSLHGGALSGAVISKAGPRGFRLQEQAVKEQKKPRRTGLERSARALSGTEKLISLAGELGMDMSEVFNDISQAKAALGQGKVASAKRCHERAKEHALGIISEGFPVLLKRTNASLRQLEKVRGNDRGLRELLDRSKEAMKRGDCARALLLMSDARSKMQCAQEETVLRIIHDGKGEFVKAKRTGINIEEAVVLLNSSRDNLRAGDFLGAIRCARESRGEVRRALERHRDARGPLVESIRTIRLAESLGADTGELNGMLAEARQLFMMNQLERSAECSRNLLGISRKTAYDKAAESYQLAEKALMLAKQTTGDVPESEEKLRRARELLEKNELAKSFSMSCASIFESDSAIANALMERLRGIDEFGKAIENDVESLTEVREAIEISKERNLENLRKYATLTESIVGEAYECAAAYTRVAQDIVKQAYENSVQLRPAHEMPGMDAIRPALPSEISSADARPSDQKRQRLIELFLTGRVSEDQLDKLLLMVDASIQKDSLV